MSTNEIEERQLELELINKLPDNGIRESALLELKRKWDKEEDITVWQTLGILIFFAALFTAGYATGTWNHEKLISKRIETVKDNYNYNTDFLKTMDFLEYIETGETGGEK